MPTTHRKYNTIVIITKQINVLISICGMEEFTSKKAQLELILNLWKKDKEWVVTEVLNNNAETLPGNTQVEHTSHTLPGNTQVEHTSHTLPENTQFEDTSDTVP